MSEVHIVGDEGDVEVWLDLDAEEAEGLCIGHASTRAKAIEIAIEDLRAGLVHLEALKSAA